MDSKIRAGVVMRQERTAAETAQLLLRLLHREILTSDQFSSSYSFSRNRTTR